MENIRKIPKNGNLFIIVSFSLQNPDIWLAVMEKRTNVL